jgi:hypothetical protein
MKSYEEIVARKDQITEQIMSLPDVNGIGITRNEHIPGYSIIVFMRDVNRWTMLEIEKIIGDDIPISIEVIGGIVAG